MKRPIIRTFLETIPLQLLALWLFGERWRLLRPSTWKMIKEYGVRRIVNFSALHAYVYARWTNQYVGILINQIFSLLKPKGRKWLADHYHGKVLTQRQAEAIVTLDQDIPLQDLEQIIPYPIARNLVLKGSPDIIAYECCCRHARKNPCKPTQVCMVIGQPMVDFILEHNPQSSRRLTQDEALELLREEHERGHMHSAWFKDACLERFYAICNCCKCCCGGIEAMTKYGVPMLAPSGYVAQVKKDLCSLCGVCVDACPFGALSLNESSVVMDWDKCMGCGVCVEKCPNSARTLVRDERKGIPLDVRVLVQKQEEVRKAA